MNENIKKRKTVLEELAKKAAKKQGRWTESDSDEETHYDKDGNLLPCYGICSHC